MTHRRLEARPASERTYWREPQWLLGLVAMTLASVCALGNYALLGQSRAAAMASLTIITNAVMARYYLGEAFTWRDAIVAAVIMAGIVVAVIFGSSAGGAASLPLQSLVDELMRPAAAGMAAGVVAVGGIFVAFITYAVRRGVARSHLEARLECVARAFLAGLFSGLTGFLAKFVVVVVESMFRSHSADDLKRYEFWLMLIFLPVSIVFQLRELNGGLRRFDATEVVPMYQSAIVIWGVTFGWGFYEENADLEERNEILFAVGVAVSILGIAAIGLLKRPVAADGTGAADSETTVLDDSAVDSTKLLSGVEAADASAAAAAPTKEAPLFAPAHVHHSHAGAHSGAGATDAERTTTSKRVVAPASHEFPMPGAGFIEAVTAFAPASVARLVAPSDADEESTEVGADERRSLLAPDRGVSLPNLRR